MITVGPNTALALSFSGVLGIYLECLRPGRIIYGCLGIALLFWGCYSLWLFHMRLEGLLLLAVSLLLFAFEAFFNARFFAGAAATVALFGGLKTLLAPPHRLHPVFAFSIAVVLGLITTLLCASAREARRSKWADLPQKP